MAEYKDLMNEKTPKTQQTSLTQKADSRMERIAEISNVSRTVATMQKKLDQQIAKNKKDVQRSEDLAAMRDSMISVLGKMSQTVGTIGKGFVNVAGSTAKASAEMVKGIGSALSQDLQLNKQNIVAMALSKTSPIFGFFVSRFMQTEAFQKAKERIKIGLADALGSVTEKFRTGFHNFVNKLKFDREKREVKNPVKSAMRGKERIPKGSGPLIKVPKLQTGGHVIKPGLVHAEAGEAVVRIKPIEEQLESVDKRLGLTQQITSVAAKAQVDQAANLKTYVRSSENFHKVGLFRGFLKALSEVQNEYTEPSNIRMLRAVLAIQDTLGATIGTWSQVFQKMLIQHPFFRNMFLTYNTLRKTFGVITAPIYALFRTRGGGLAQYKAHLAKSGNPLHDMSQNIGTTYIQQMYRLDTIAKFTRATAEATRDLSTAITGRRYPRLEGLNIPTFTWFGNLRKLLNWSTKGTLKIAGKIFKSNKLVKLAETLTKERKLLPEIVTQAYQKVVDFFRENAATRAFAKEYSGIYGTGGTVEGFGENKSCLSELCSKFASYFDEATPVFQELKKRIFPEVQIISSTNQLTYDNIKSIAENTSEVASRDKWRWLKEKKESMFDWFKKIGSWIWMGLGVAWNFISSLPDKFMGLIPTFLSKGMPSIISALGAAAPVLGKAAMVAAVGYLAYEGAKKILEATGFYQWFKEDVLDRFDEKTKEIISAVTKQQVSDIKDVRTKFGEEGYEAHRKLKLQAIPSKFSREEEAAMSGLMGEHKFKDVFAAQQKYMLDNFSQYMMYHPDELARVRKEWLQKGYQEKVSIWSDPHEVAKKREEGFLDFLKKRGRPMTELEMSQHKSWFYEEQKKAGIKNPAAMRPNLTVGELFDDKFREMGYAFNNQIRDFESKAKEIQQEYSKKYGPKLANLAGMVMNPAANYWDKAKQTELYKNLSVELEQAKKQYGPEAEKMVSELQTYMNQMTASALELTQPQVQHIMEILKDKSGEAQKLFLEGVDPKYREKVKDMVKAVEMEMSKLAATEVATIENMPQLITDSLNKQSKDFMKLAKQLSSEGLKRGEAIVQQVVNSPTVVNAPKTAVNAAKQGWQGASNFYSDWASKGMGSTF